MHSTDTEPASPPGGIDAWADQTLQELVDLPDVCRAGVALVEGGGRRFLFTASDRRRDDGLGWCHVDAFSAVPLNDVIRSSDPVAASIDELDARYDEYAAAQHGTDHVAVANLALVADGTVRGGLVLYYDRRQAFDEQQVAHLATISDRLARRLASALSHTSALPRPDHESAPDALIARRDIPADLAAVAEARHFLRRTLTAWDVDEEVRANAVLCLSELVTNAMIHTTGGCHVQVELRDGVLTSHVHDNGSVVTPAAVDAHDAVQAHGHGLRVVAALSDRWGRTTDPDGALAWFELAVS